MTVTEKGAPADDRQIQARQDQTVLRPNTVLNRRYRLDKRTRVSSESESFLAFDALLQRSVTVELPVDAGSPADVFIYRRQVASALHHRNILATLDIGEDHGYPYVVSEYFPGDTLGAIIRNEAPFDTDDVAILIEQLAQGLSYAHNRGIVHGVLSPDAVIIDSAGLAKITGFGMIEGQMLSETGTRGVVSEGPYQPANLRGNSLITQALDVHALASIAFEMMTGAKVKADEESYSPSVVNAAIPARAGDTVLLGLRAFDVRSGLTAMQFSHALTHWRSWTMQGADSVSGYPTDAIDTRLPASPVPPAFNWALPEPAYRRDRDVNGVTAVTLQAERKPPVLRWLTLLLVVAIVATIALVYWDDESGPAASIAELPSELSQLFSALSE